jgi:hypothetical protein
MPELPRELHQLAEDAAKRNASDVWRINILSQLSEIAASCGALCEINSPKNMVKYARATNQYFQELQVPVDCRALFSTPLIDVSDGSVPYPMLEELKPYYSLNGTVDLIMWRRFVDVYSGKEARVSHWSARMVQQMKRQASRSKLIGNYGRPWTNEVKVVLDRFGEMRDKSVLVIGSENPWVESICLLLGARSVTTLEYGRITTDVPQIKTMTPPEMREAYLNGTLPEYDIVVTYSSVEHSGLGRYGDSLNPWGDLLAVARAWCVTKEKGRLVIGVPTGKDRIEFNACRVYGKHRYPLLTANWRLISESRLEELGQMKRKFSEGGDYAYQPPLVFEKLSLAQ